MTIKNTSVLGWRTIFCFLVSKLFLIILLITYAIFPQLRTLPGKNLMNLATGLLMNAIVWIISSFGQLAQFPAYCTAMVVAQHYFLLTSFASVSVNSFHTCKTFARKMPTPKSSERLEKKLLKLYLTIVWFLPDIFGGTCMFSFRLERHYETWLWRFQNLLVSATRCNHLLCNYSCRYFIGIQHCVIRNNSCIPAKTQSKHGRSCTSNQKPFKPVNKYQTLQSNGIYVAVWFVSRRR